MSIILKVEPDVLRGKSEELNQNKTNIMGIMEQVKSDISSLTSAWRSAASDVYQSKFKQVYDDIDNMLAIISEHIYDLNEAASIYATAENAAQAVNEALPTDGVFRV